MPFTLRNLKEDLEDLGSRFDGAPDLEFRVATKALELEQSGLSFQSIPPTKRTGAGVQAAAVPDRAWSLPPESAEVGLQQNDGACLCSSSTGRPKVSAPRSRRV